MNSVFSQYTRNSKGALEQYAKSTLKCFTRHSGALTLRVEIKFHKWVGAHTRRYKSTYCTRHKAHPYSSVNRRKIVSI